MREGWRREERIQQEGQRKYDVIKGDIEDTRKKGGMRMTRKREETEGRRGRKEKGMGGGGEDLCRLLVSKLTARYLFSVCRLFISKFHQSVLHSIQLYPLFTLFIY